LTRDLDPSSNIQQIQINLLEMLLLREFWTSGKCCQNFALKKDYIFGINILYICIVYYPALTGTIKM
jgi:hypothetical protein